jgi:hypothetical protein
MDCKSEWTTTWHHRRYVGVTR